MWAFCCLQVHWDNGHNEEHFRFNEHSSCETEKKKKKESVFCQVKGSKQDDGVLLCYSKNKHTSQV